MPFNVKKTTQAIGVLLRAHGTSRMSYMRLLKLLYIADRESLRDIGKPVTCDRIVAMENGPVPSGTLDLVNDQYMESQFWNQHLRRVQFDLEMTQDPGHEELSQYEIRKLQELANRYVGLDQFELALLTHEFEEWKKNYHPGTSTPIPFRDILVAVGRGEVADEILREASEQLAVDRLLATLQA